jgi:hypothetical protein
LIDSVTFDRVSGHPFGILSGDPHHQPIRYLLENKVSQKVISIKSPGELGPFVTKTGNLNLLAGPEIETILWGGVGRPVETGILYAGKGVRVKVGKPEKIPYYALYPLLIFEDEFDGWRLASRKEFGQDDYRTGKGAVTLWPVTREPVPGDDDITDLVETISETELRNPKPAFGPGLLLDGGTQDIHAWHSETDPQHPLSIDVAFSRNVSLRQLGFQAQWGGPGNLRRAPREIKILGEDRFRNLKELASARLDFVASGFWSFVKLPGTGARFRFYRILILNNHGDKNFTTLQEMKFYGVAGDET